MGDVIWIVVLTLLLSLDLNELRLGKGNALTIWAVILVTLAIIFRVCTMLIK